MHDQSHVSRNLGGSPTPPVFDFTSDQSSPSFRSNNPPWFSASSPTQPQVTASGNGLASSNHPSRTERTFRPNPLLQRPEDARDRRRNLFLKKIQTHRDAKLMQARGGEDEMIRMIYLSEKRRWEDSHQRTAIAMTPSDMQLDDQPPDRFFENLDQADMEVQNADMLMLDEMADLERREIEEIVMQLEDPLPRNQSVLSDPGTCSRCGSDEILSSNMETTCFNCGLSYNTDKII